MHLLLLRGETPTHDNERHYTCWMTEYRLRCILSYMRLSGLCILGITAHSDQVTGVKIGDMAED